MSRNETEVQPPAPAPLTPPKATDEQLPLFSADTLEGVEKKETRWRRDVLDPVLAKKPYWKKDYTTVSEMEVNPMATPLSIAGQDLNEIGYPSEFPYTRGVHPTGYRERL